jgi:hypothetical protein
LDPTGTAKSVCEWAYEVARRRDGARFALVDVAGFNLPLLDEGAPAMMLDRAASVADDFDATSWLGGGGPAAVRGPSLSPTLTGTARG